MAKAKVVPKAKVVVPKVKGLRFTPNCYLVLGVTADVPHIPLTPALHKTAIRLVQHGLMTAKEVEVEQEAGVSGGFKYKVKMPGYELTPEGRALYEQYNSLVKGVNPLRIQQAMRGERLKEQFILKAQRTGKLK